MRKRYDFDSPEDFDGLGEQYNEKQRSSIHSMHVLFGCGLFIYIICLYGAVYVIDEMLPTPLTVADEAAHPDAFITERAYHDLKLLTSLGPKIVGGYENEVLAVDFLRREIQFIVQGAHKNQKIEVDFQVVSGRYNLSFMNVKAINTFNNVQNVVVKLYGKNESKVGLPSSLLVNSHFDSVPTSPGASDDGINVVAMLESLRKLSKRSERLNQNVIFLFNGAEESALQASHGFIAQHKWAKECKVVINLDSAGLGGKIVLFQTGPKRPWLMKYYSMVPHPYGQVAGEEIFQSNIIPSDTDFRIFRDFGGLVGLDMAFFKNGYVYHTKFDKFDSLPLGSIQNVGDNVLSLIKNIGNSAELADDSNTAHGNAVYFDVLGQFMVSYTEVTALILNLLTVGISLVIFAKSLIDFRLGYNLQTVKKLCSMFGIIVLGWICSLCFVILTAFILDQLHLSMSWYTNIWMLVGLYVIPTVAISGFFITFLDYKNLSINIQAQLQAHVTRLFWTIVLFIGTVLNIRSTYTFLLPVMTNSLVFVIVYLFKLQHAGKTWQILYILGLTIPTLMLMNKMHIILSLFIPITGRIGSNKNVDIIIGLMAAVFTLLIVSPYMIFITLIRKARLLLSGLVVIFVVTFILTFTPLGFPYSGNPNSPTPQRYWSVHASRVVHAANGNITNKESGYFLLNMDRNSPYYVESIVKDFSRAKYIREDCKKFSVCGAPLAHAKMMQILEHSTWISAGPPIIHEPANLKVKSKEFISTNIMRINVTVTGPDRLSMYIVPLENMTLLGTSLIDSRPELEEKANNKMYYILNTSGKEKSPVEFSFDVKVPDRHDGPIVDFVLNAIYVHSNVVRTPHYQEFINAFPDWADLTAWLGTYESWIL